MAKKTTTPAAASKSTKSPAARGTVTKAAPASVSAAEVSTPVRNTPIPKVATPAARKEITQEMIARRAYEIYLSGTGGSEIDNWHRAERELRGA